jgi:hypothetical protein
MLFRADTALLRHLQDLKLVERGFHERRPRLGVLRWIMVSGSFGHANQIGSATDKGDKGVFCRTGRFDGANADLRCGRNGTVIPAAEVSSTPLGITAETWAASSVPVYRILADGHGVGVSLV